MLNQLIKKPILSCSIIFVICSVARLFEYLYMRTDDTFLSENFLHKLFGILLLWGILSISKLRWIDIGFTPNGIIRGIGNGLLFGLGQWFFLNKRKRITSRNLTYSLKCVV